MLYDQPVFAAVKEFFVFNLNASVGCQYQSLFDHFRTIHAVVRFQVEYHVERDLFLVLLVEVPMKYYDLSRVHLVSRNAKPYVLGRITKGIQFLPAYFILYM